MNFLPPIFDRPIIILSAPRAGSTLLFETLSQAKDLWTIGTESHAVIEHIPEFSTVYNGFKSNELTELHGNEQSINVLKTRFASQLRNNQSIPYQLNQGAIRFLEKTPKNSLRIRFLNKVFPDALFIHLVRDPRENISSIMDGWHSKHFITYPNLPGFNNRWSYLLPPNWQALQGKTIDEIASFQWQVCNQTITNELEQLPQNRWCMINYQDFLDNTYDVINKLCRFSGITMDDGLSLHCQKALPYSAFTLTKPVINKWHKNKVLLEKNMPELTPLVEKLNQRMSQFSDYTITNNIEKN